MNVDYSICKALSYRTNGFAEAQALYDIGCQWIVWFHSRVDRSGHISLPPGLKLHAAVGKWHLSAHIADCYPKFSLNYLPGAGQVEGEIMETLWAVLNGIAAMARAMSKWSRVQFLNSHMNWSNWKKLLGAGEYSDADIKDSS